MNIREALTFDDVCLLPDYSEVTSRKEVDLSSEILPGLKFDIPIISANMNMVTEGKMIEEMTSRGATSGLHRYITTKKLHEILFSLPKETWKKFGISVGANPEQYEPFLETVIANNFWERIGYIIIDVAHGHHLLVKNALKKIKELIPKNIPILAGNVCTYRAALNIAEWGADGIKGGIGNGAMCTTRIVAGVGFPQLSAIMECKRAVDDFFISTGKRVTLVGDGGLKTSGDCVKGLAAGADFLMSGSFFSGTKESPGNVLSLPGNKKVKLYNGMSSIDAQVTFYGKEAEEIVAEGVSTLVEYKGTIHRVLNQLVGGMRSGFSYCGCFNIKELHEYGKFEDSWVKVTSSGFQEGLPHGAKQ
ncbi:guanosine monophosphate reductase [Candidatus Gracilibacteria bacterium]|nr:guanosine monophosphate reductase [Candidatus Gracilibacteria bacterium]